MAILAFAAAWRIVRQAQEELERRAYTRRSLRRRLNKKAHGSHFPA
jgi:hypothetical protein